MPECMRKTVYIMLVLRCMAQMYVKNSIHCLPLRRMDKMYVENSIHSCAGAKVILFIHRMFFLFVYQYPVEKI